MNPLPFSSTRQEQSPPIPCNGNVIATPNIILCKKKKRKKSLLECGNSRLITFVLPVVLNDNFSHV